MNISSVHESGREVVRDLYDAMRIMVASVGEDRVAASMQWSKGNLRQWLNSNDPNPTVLTLARVADALGLELEVRFK